MFFSFDGVDGAGKSTQIRLLAEALVSRGREVITCRDPGSTPLGDRLRGALLVREVCLLELQAAFGLHELAALLVQAIERQHAHDLRATLQRKVLRLGSNL